MKLAIATLLTGGTFLAGSDLPTVGYDECAVVTVDIDRGEPTFIEPEPKATGMRVFVYCGHRVPRETGTGYRNDQAIKWLDIDTEQAEVIVDAASDLLDDGEVFLP